MADDAGDLHRVHPGFFQPRHEGVAETVEDQSLPVDADQAAVFGEPDYEAMAIGSLAVERQFRPQTFVLDRLHMIEEAQDDQPGMDRHQPLASLGLGLLDVEAPDPILLTDIFSSQFGDLLDPHPGVQTDQGEPVLEVLHQHRAGPLTPISPPV